MINKHKIYITHNNKLLKFNNTLNNINTNICKKIKCFKTSVNKILLKNNINVPQHEVFNKITTLNDIDYIINKKITNYPLVVKQLIVWV